LAAKKKKTSKKPNEDEAAPSIGRTQLRKRAPSIKRSKFRKAAKKK